MSEPLSTGEIEDVLSSIRRLVSDDLRPSPKSNPIAALVDSKLILTPALRVVHSTPPAAEAVAEGAAAEPSVEMQIATIGAAVAAQDHEWEDEDANAAVAAPASVGTSDWDIEMAQDGVFLPAQPTHSEEDLAQVALPVEETDVFGAAESAADVSHGSFAPEETFPEEIASWASVTASDGDATDVAPEPEAEASPVLDPAWVDAAEASVIAQLEADAEPEPSAHTSTMGPEAVSVDADGEMRFNEEVLRDLVRDLIREELQGKLGERMTRNMRKLIRVELSRFLATQDLTEE